MNRRKSLMLLYLLLPMLALSQRVSDDETQAIAVQLLGKQVVKSEAKSLMRSPAKGDQSAQFYSIYTGEDGQGFVIVSTDRRASQVIGYGDGKTDPDNLPPQLKAILEKHDSVLRVSPNLPEHSSWRSYAPIRIGENGGIRLGTPDWGQGYPYNYYAPVMQGQRALTGCVATAMAILMNYHKWPKYGKGSHSYTLYDKVTGEELTLSYDFSKPVDWDNIIEDYSDSKNYTLAQAEAIGDLMYRCGVGIDMQYSPSASGAFDVDIPYVLSAYSFYSPSCDVAYKDKNYGGNLDWDALVRNELEESGPVILAGGDHCFVCDGYNDKGFLHINWGWDGYYNGYFSSDDMGENGFYSDGLRAVIGVRHEGCEANPNHHGNGDFVSEEDLSPLRIRNLRGLGLQLDVENIVQGEPFNAYITDIEAWEDFEGKIALVLTSEDGTVKKVIKEHDYSLKKKYNDFLLCRFTNCVLEGMDPEEGDWVKLMSKAYGSDQWKEFIGTKILPSRAKARGNEVKRAKVYFDVSPAELDVKGVVDNCYYDENSDIVDKYTYCDNPVLSSNYYIEVDKPENIDIVKVFLEDGEPAIELTKYNEKWYDIPFQTVDAFEYHIKVRGISSADLIDHMEVTVATPGTLNSMLSENQTEMLKSLKVSGKINSKDIYFMRDKMTNLTDIDMKDARIVAFNKDEMDDMLPNDAFMQKMLNSVVLPNNLAAIGWNAFYETRLEDITLPKTVKHLCPNALWTRSVGKKITCLAETPPVSEYKVVDGEESAVLLVPKGCRKKYANAEYWGDIGIIIEADSLRYEELNGLVYMLGNEDAHLVKLAKLDGPDISVPSHIDIDGFDYPVVSIVGPVFHAGDNQLAFDIRTISIPATITDIGDYSLAYLHNLKGINVDKANERFFDHEGVLYDRQNAQLFYFPNAKQVLRYDVPEGIESMRQYDMAVQVDSISFPTTFKEMGIFGQAPQTFICHSTTPPNAESNFHPCPENSTLIVPVGTVQVYRNATGWRKFGNIKEFENNSDRIETVLDTPCGDRFPAFNLLGQPVSKDFKGLVIQNGCKVLCK